MEAFDLQEIGRRIQASRKAKKKTPKLHTLEQQLTALFSRAQRQ